MLKRLLLAYDGSPYSEAAQTYCFNLAKAHGALVNALYVIDQGILSGPHVAVPGPAFVPMEVIDFQAAQEELRAKGRGYLDAVCAAAASEGIECHDLLRIGYPDQVILKEARSHDLVVIGRKGNSDIKEETLGYTGEMLAHNSAVPLLLAPKEHKSIDHCLIAYDGSQQAVRAMRSLRQVIDGTGWKVTVLTVREAGNTGESTAREAEDYLKAHGIAVDVLVKEGDVTKSVLEAVQTTGADILAMGAFGHRGLREIFWGGTTNKVLAQATIAVLVAH